MIKKNVKNLPVIHSIIPPREGQVCPFLKNQYTCTGEKAFSTLLSYFQMLIMPIPPIKRNQTKTIGAKSQPTLSTPKCCTLNKTTNIATATSTTASVVHKTIRSVA